MKGKIERLSPKQGVGFIRSESGEEYFFNKFGLEGVDIQSFEVGDTVEFVIEEFQDRESRAVKIRIALP